MELCLTILVLVSFGYGASLFEQSTSRVILLETFKNARLIPIHSQGRLLFASEDHHSKFVFVHCPIDSALTHSKRTDRL